MSTLDIKLDYSNKYFENQTKKSKWKYNAAFFFKYLRGKESCQKFFVQVCIGFWIDIHEFWKYPNIPMLFD